jgi:two-component system nitrate/nitrite response regulator NarL
MVRECGRARRCRVRREGENIFNMTPRVTAAAIQVLLVDDHRTMLWGLEKLIESQRPGMVVAGKATSGAEAIAMADRLRPDVVLLDIDLAGQSAIDVIPALVRSKAKVVVLTEQRHSLSCDSAVHAGARGIVYKEEPAETILKAIEKVHAGELWLDRVSTGRILAELQNRSVPGRRNGDWAAEAGLTVRERELIDELLQDPSGNYARIATKLHISEHTVRNHLTSIYSKLGLQNRLELFVFASNARKRSVDVFLIVFSTIGVVLFGD